jgi:DNA polymerase delta subunit 4
MVKDEHRDEEEALTLRQFDMDMKYGPCIGVDRLKRWERAAAMGLHPPSCVRDLLVAPAVVSVAATGNLQCLWEGRV